MTQYDYYSQLIYSLVLTTSLVGVVAFLLVISYVLYLLSPYVGPRK